MAKGSSKKETPTGQAPLKFTTFSVTGFVNGKNASCAFVKSDGQMLSSRKVKFDEEADTKEREKKKRRLLGNEDDPAAAATGDNVLKAAPQGRVQPAYKPEAATTASPTDGEAADGEDSFDPRTRTIVIHPGSRWLRIGRASDAFPLAIPNVIAKYEPTKARQAAEAQRQYSSSYAKRPAKLKMTVQASSSGQPAAPIQSNAAGDDEDEDDNDNEEMADEATGDDEGDTLAAKIASLRGDLRARMRIFKLRGQGNGNAQAATYNAEVRPETIPEYAPDGDNEWADVSSHPPYIVGSEALKIADPEKEGYVLRWPFYAGDFDTTGYSTLEHFFHDLEIFYVEAMKELDIHQSQIRDYSVIFLIPDLYSQDYVHHMSDFLLKRLGFKRLILQQESVCATFGAGISSACVVDVGAKTTTVTCIEEGLVIADSRMKLDFGGDDITFFLFQLLLRLNFPYKEADLSRWYDFAVLDNIKERMVVLGEGDVGLSLYDFIVKQPGRKPMKYSVRSYDDAIIAAYSLFSPRVIDFDSKLDQHDRPRLTSEDIDEIYDIGEDMTTNAMRNSTRHLFPDTPLEAAQSVPAPEVTADDAAVDGATPVAAAPAEPKADEAAASTTVGPSQDRKIAREAAKMPLDVAIVESVLACETEERMRKVASNVLTVGGSSQIYNFGFALSSRCGPALAARFPALNGVFAIVPPPKDVDPSVLAWKGICALPKVDVAADLWITKDDYESYGLRIVKERAFFFA